LRERMSWKILGNLDCIGGAERQRVRGCAREAVDAPVLDIQSCFLIKLSPSLTLSLVRPDAPCPSLRFPVGRAFTILPQATVPDTLDLIRERYEAPFLVRPDRLPRQGLSERRDHEQHQPRHGLQHARRALPALWAPRGSLAPKPGAVCVISSQGSLSQTSTRTNKKFSF
jgi:hypothetical protein